MLSAVTNRLLGVGAASILAIVSLGLVFTGRLQLYINPDSTWFVVAMSVTLLLGSLASFLVPLGEESDHGHDHSHGHGHSHDHGSSPLSTVVTIGAGLASASIVVPALIFPPAVLSVDLAMSRDVGTPPLSLTTDDAQLATMGDTSSFGIGSWARVFHTATVPESYDGITVELTGFVTGSGDDVRLNRLVITHCVIDAQPASVPFRLPEAETVGEGKWVRVSGVIREDSGTLTIDETTVDQIAEPADPYEY